MRNNTLRLLFVLALCVLVTPACTKGNPNGPTPSQCPDPTAINYGAPEACRYFTPNPSTALHSRSKAFTFWDGTKDVTVPDGAFEIILYPDSCRPQPGGQLPTPGQLTSTIGCRWEFKVKDGIPLVGGRGYKANLVTRDQTGKRISSCSIGGLGQTEYVMPGSTSATVNGTATYGCLPAGVTEIADAIPLFVNGNDNIMSVGFDEPIPLHWRP